MAVDRPQQRVDVDAGLDLDSFEQVGPLGQANRWRVSTASSCRTWPLVNSRRWIPSVDGA